VKNLLKTTQKALTSLWTYVVVGLLAFYVLLYLLLDLPANLNDVALVNPMRTLLGGLATGLITAQALVFTISLVTAQLNARYTHRMVSRVFTWPTGLYMGLFIGSSIYSMVVLAVLSSQLPNFAVQLPLGLKPLHPVTIALALAGTCLVLLVPYLWSFKQRLDPERMARDEGRRAKQHLQRGIQTEPQGVASLDNIVMSAFGYGDYDTFGWGLNELSDVGLEAWGLPRATLGESIFRRIAHIGVATIDDPRAPFQVIDALGTVGSTLVYQGVQEAARQAAVAMSEIGEEAVRKDHAALTRQVALALSALGSQAADRGLVAVAEEAAYSLGHLGGLAARHGMEDSTRQLAAYLRRVGSRAAQRQLDLVTRQAMVSLWSLGGNTVRHLPQSAEVVARELEMMERVADAELLDASYLSAPRSEDLENFRLHYMKEEQEVSEDGASDRKGS
jgi:hypothetical protein